MVLRCTRCVVFDKDGFHLQFSFDRKTTSEWSKCPRFCPWVLLIITDILSIGLPSLLCVFRESVVHPSLLYRSANCGSKQPQLFCLECHCVPENNCHPDGTSPGGSSIEVRRDFVCSASLTHLTLSGLSVERQILTFSDSYPHLSSCILGF